MLFAIGIVGGISPLASCAQPSSYVPPLIVSIERDGDGCRVTVAGERVTNERLPEIARGGGNRRGIVLYDQYTPYKCLGGAIFNLQRAGLKSVDAAMRDGS